MTRYGTAPSDASASSAADLSYLTTSFQVLNLGAEFYNRIHGHAPEDLDHTPLQKRIRQVVKAIRTRDANGGDGGAGMLTALLQFAERAAPPANFATIPAYYSYRTNHAATK